MIRPLFTALDQDIAIGPGALCVGGCLFTRTLLVFSFAAQRDVCFPTGPSDRGRMPSPAAFARLKDGEEEEDHDADGGGAGPDDDDAEDDDKKVMVLVLLPTTPCSTMTTPATMEQVIVQLILRRRMMKVVMLLLMLLVMELHLELVHLLPYDRNICRRSSR